MGFLLKGSGKGGAGAFAGNAGAIQLIGALDLRELSGLIAGVAIGGPALIGKARDHRDQRQGSHKGDRPHASSAFKHMARSDMRRLVSPRITRPPARFQRGSSLQAPVRSPALALRSKVERQAAAGPTL